MKRTGIVVMVLVFCSGCCSLFRESSQLITVDSNIQGAEVKVGDAIGTTPFSLKIPKGKEYVITVNPNGKSQSRLLERRVDGLYWVNILWWPALIIDAITGKMFVYDPTSYKFEF